MGKYKLLVYKNSDGIIPKGYISDVLGPEQYPSEYERSNDSPWDIVEVDYVPAPVNFPFALEYANKTIPIGKQRLFFRNGEIKLVNLDEYKKEVKRERIIKSFPYPSTVEQGSLIWDYGPRATYHSPQAAFDACLAHWGNRQIDSTQYIRGESGIYTTAFDWMPFVHFRDLKTDGRAGHFLVFDAKQNASVYWRGGYYGAVGALTEDDIEDAVRHVRFIGFNIFLDSGISGVVSQINSSEYMPDIERFEIIQMRIERPTYGGGSAITLPGVLFPYIARSYLLRFSYGAPLYLGMRNDKMFFLTVLSSVIDAEEAAIFFNANLNTLQGGTFASSLFKGKYGFLSIAEGIIGWQKCNCIFKNSHYGIYTPNTAAYIPIDIESYSNFYDCDISPYGDKNGPVSLDVIQKRLFGIERMSRAGKLTLDETYKAIPYPDSPVYRAGLCEGIYDIQNTLISKGVIDIGPYQLTKAYPYHPAYCGYCTPQDVIEATGVEPEDLGYTNSNDLEGLLCRWIYEVSNIINSYCDNSWGFGKQPEGITRAAVSMMADLISIAIQRRKTPFIQIGDFAVKQVQDDLLSDNHKNILNLYKKKKSVEIGISIL